MKRNIATSVKENATRIDVEKRERERETKHGAAKIDTEVGWRVSLLGSFVYR